MLRNSFDLIRVVLSYIFVQNFKDIDASRSVFFFFRTFLTFSFILFVRTSISMQFAYVVCLSKHNTRTMYLVEMHFLKSLLQMRFTLIV